MSTQSDFDSQDALDDDAADGRTAKMSERQRLLGEWNAKYWGVAHLHRIWESTHIARDEVCGYEYGQVFLDPIPDAVMPTDPDFVEFQKYSDSVAVRLRAIAKMEQRARSQHHGESLPNIKEADPHFVVGDMIATGETCIVYGAPKAGKSAWAHKLAICVASENLDFDSLPVLHGRVLFVTLDPGARKEQVKKRMAEICKRLEVPQSERLILVDRPVYLDDPQSVASLLRDNPGGFALVVIDPLYRAVSNGDPSRPETIHTATESIITILEATGAAVVILHHETKTGNIMLGAQTLAAMLDSRLYVERKKDRVTVTVEVTKNSEPPEQPFTYRLEKEFLASLDDDSPRKDAAPTYERPDLLAMMPAEWTPTYRARGLVEHMLSATTKRAKEQEWLRLRTAWEDDGLIEQRNRRLRRVTP